MFMRKALLPLQEEILQILRTGQASYARPMNSREIGQRLNITPCYIRKQLGALVARRLVGVRRGSGGGYYIHSRRGKDMGRLNAVENQIKYYNDLSESLSDMGEYIPRLTDGLSRIAFTLQTGRGENAHRLLDQALEGMEFYFKLIASAQNILGIDYLKYEIDGGKTAAEVINELKNAIEMLHEAYRNRDMTTTADLIEYELIPVLEGANAILEQLKKSVEKKMVF